MDTTQEKIDLCESWYFGLHTAHCIYIYIYTVEYQYNEILGTSEINLL